MMGAMKTALDIEAGVEILKQIPVVKRILETRPVGEPRDGILEHYLHTLMFLTDPREILLNTFNLLTYLSDGRYSGNEFAHQLLNLLVERGMLPSDVIIVNKQEYHKLQQMSIIDELTKVYNRRYIIESLEREHDRAIRTGVPYSIAIFDVDDFKSFNDTHGHQVGDAVLREVGRLAQETLRKMDLVGRYGGDEFLIILPETTEEDAISVARRVHRAVEGSDIVQGPIRVSMGVAGSRKGSSLGEIILLADNALLRAKKIGKNSVFSSKDDMRKSSRFSVNTMVGIIPQHTNEYYTARLLNISSTGACVNCDAYSPAWDILTMRFDVGGTEPITSPVARIVHVTNKQNGRVSQNIGLQFVKNADIATIIEELTQISGYTSSSSPRMSY